MYVSRGIRDPEENNMAVEFESLLADPKLFLTLLFSESAVYYGIVLGLVFGILTGWLARGMFGKDAASGSKDNKVSQLTCFY